MTTLQLIDDLTRGDHYFLTPGDACYFFGEYTAQKGYGYSTFNRLILNFKKSPERQASPDEWRYKVKAVKDVASLLATSLSVDDLLKLTWVPVPPSRPKGDPGHDSRLLDVLLEVKSQHSGLDVREWVVQVAPRVPLHTGVTTRNPTALYNEWAFNENLALPVPEAIAIFDDILTAGTHFKAMQRLLLERFPGVPMVGIFIARVVRDATLP